MSSIAFNSEKNTVYLRGPERFMMGAVVHNMMMLATRNISAERIIEIGKPDHYLVAQAHRVLAARAGKEGSYTEEKKLEQQFETNIKVDGDFTDQFELFEISLNTAIALGGPAIRLAARIHGQCEIHLWIAQEDAPGIADIIEQAVDLGLYRMGMGWNDVVTLLRTPDVGEIVLSYSVTESFPNDHIVIDGLLPEGGDWKTKRYEAMTQDERDEQSGKDEDRYGAWAELTRAEQWSAAMAGLREQHASLQLKIEHLTGNGFRFGDGSTGFDLCRQNEEATA